MISKETTLLVIDNSGAFKVKCIGFFKGSKKNSATLGDIIKVSVKSLKKKGSLKVKKGQVLNALIVSVKKNLGSKKRFNGFSKRFSSNCVILLNNNNKMIGSRITGNVDSFLRNNLKLKSLLLNYNFI